MICFYRWERFTAHQECSWKFLQKSRRKKNPFLNKNIPYLEEGMGWKGIQDGLENKIYPMLFLKSLGPLAKKSHTINKMSDASPFCKSRLQRAGGKTNKTKTKNKCKLTGLFCSLGKRKCITFKQSVHSSPM